MEVTLSPMNVLTISVLHKEAGQCGVSAPRLQARQSVLSATIPYKTSGRLASHLVYHLDFNKTQSQKHWWRK